MGKTIHLLRNLLLHVKNSSWFSIIADEATDISRNEQVSLSVYGQMMITVSMRSA